MDTKKILNNQCECKSLLRSDIRTTDLPFLSSICRWYWRASEVAALAGPSPHLSLRVWWLKAVHSRRGGCGGRGFVFSLKVWLKGPVPRLFWAWIRILRERRSRKVTTSENCNHRGSVEMLKHCRDVQNSFKGFNRCQAFIGLIPLQLLSWNIKQTCESCEITPTPWKGLF